MKKNYIFLVSVIAFMLLFYKQSVGINLFVFNVFLVVLVFLFVPTARENRNMWLISAGALITSASAAWYADFSSIFLNILTLIAMPIFLHQKRGTMLFAETLGIWNTISAPVRIFTERKMDKEDSSKNLAFKRILLYGVLPFVVLVLFIYLYRFINPVWGDYIWRFIGSIFSWTFILLLLLATILLYAFWYFVKSSRFAQFAVNRANELQPTEKPTFKNIPLDMEMGSGILLFALLNLLLFSLLVADFQQLFVVGGIPEGYTLSEYLHKGVYAVILSIIFAITLIVFYFKGAFNYYKKSKWLRILTWAWIGLNAVLVLFTLYKNVLYVEVYDLTFKRVSVFIYLLLCWVGLYFTGIKLKMKKTFVYIVRKMYWSFYIMWVLTTPINWTNFMTIYNLNHAKEKDYKEKTIDLDYLLTGYKSLDELNIEALEKFLRENPDNPYAKRLKKGLDQKYLDVVKSDKKRKWRGKRLYDLYIKNLLKSVAYKPFYAEIDDGVFYPELKEVQVLDYDFGYQYEHKPEDFKIYAQALQKYQNVKVLKLLGGNNEVKSLHLLDSLPHLKKLDVKNYYWGANDFQLEGCPQLEEIAIDYINKRNLNIASSYPNLKVLYIRCDYARTITGWENVANLKELELHINEDEEIDLTPLIQLEKLSLEGKQSLEGEPKSCTLKGNFTSLKELRLRKFTVNLKESKKLKNLEILHYTKSRSVDLKGIEQMPKLRVLNASYNNLKSIEEIKKLEKLENLDIGHNSIKDISILKNLKSLRSLDITSNFINDIAVLYELPNLERLYASKLILRKLDLGRLPKGITIPYYEFKDENTDPTMDMVQEAAGE